MQSRRNGHGRQRGMPDRDGKGTSRGAGAGRPGDRIDGRPLECADAREPHARAQRRDAARTRLVLAVAAADRVAFWIVMTVANAVANTTTVLMDIHRVGLDFADWGAGGLGVVQRRDGPRARARAAGLDAPGAAPLGRTGPADRAAPAGQRGVPRWSTWSAWSRCANWPYTALGGRYDFGDWPRELAYEYLKDLRGYLMLVAMIEATAS